MARRNRPHPQRRARSMPASVRAAAVGASLGIIGASARSRVLRHGLTRELDDLSSRSHQFPHPHESAYILRTSNEVADTIRRGIEKNLPTVPTRIVISAQYHPETKKVVFHPTITVVQQPGVTSVPDPRMVERAMGIFKKREERINGEYQQLLEKSGVIERVNADAARMTALKGKYQALVKHIPRDLTIGAFAGAGVALTSALIATIGSKVLTRWRESRPAPQPTRDAPTPRARRSAPQSPEQRREPHYLPTEPSPRAVDSPLGRTTRRERREDAIRREEEDRREGEEGGPPHTFTPSHPLTHEEVELHPDLRSALEREDVLPSIIQAIIAYNFAGRKRRLIGQGYLNVADARANVERRLGPLGREYPDAMEWLERHRVIRFKKNREVVSMEPHARNMTDEGKLVHQAVEAFIQKRRREQGR